MALVDRFKARYGPNRVAELTNPQKAGGAVIDEARLALAAADVEADFEIHAGIAYDDAKPTHHKVACTGVLATLRMRTDQAGTKAEAEYAAFVEQLKALALVTGRDRPLPVVQVREGERKDPEFTARSFDLLIPGRPSEGAPEIRLE